MTLDEWKKLAYLLDCWWGQPAMDDDRIAAYYSILRDQDAATVEAAARMLLEKGGDFTPSAAKMLQACRMVGGTAEPTPTEALDYVLQAIRRWPQKVHRTVALHWLLTKGEAVAGWAEISWNDIAMAPLEDPERGGQVRARLEKSYQAFLERMQADGASMRALGEATDRPLLGPRKLDPVRHIEGPDRRLEEGA